MTLKITLNDFSFSPEIIGNYCKTTGQNRNNFNLIEFNKWVADNYNIKDCNNYVLSHNDSLNSWLTNDVVYNAFSAKIIAFIKELTNLEIKKASSLMALSIIVINNEELICKGEFNYSFEYLYKTCLFLEKAEIINNELFELLNIVRSKYGAISITQKETDHYIALFKKVN